MKTLKITFITVLVLTQAIASMVFAQSKPKVGDIISGKITGMVADSIIPLKNVNVEERDSSNMVVAFCYTDVNGAFSFSLSNPDNIITIHTIGYKVVELPFDRKYYDVCLEKREDKNYSGIPVPLRETANVVYVGDTISGRIYDNDHPMKRILVLEINASNSIITRSYTDSTGTFSFKLVDPSDRLEVLYEEGRGYNVIRKPIDKHFYDINIRKEDIIPFDIVFQSQ